MTERDSVAVVGMACIFPAAPDLRSYWYNLSHAVDAISEVPPGRLDPAFYAPGVERVDRHGCARGGFIDEHAYFDPHAHGMMPVAVDVAEPEQLLTLEVAARALRDAGYEPSRKRTPENSAVVLGRGNYTSRAVTRFEQRVRGAEQVVSALRDLLPQLDEQELERVRSELQARTVAAEREAVVNLVPNLCASRLAERFHFHGPAYTLDAACASSLVAVDHACGLLREGKVDLALAGGVHLAHSEDFWCVFNQLGLLSKHGMSRPLDRRADGLLISEGVGVVVLKRAADATADGDRIYARVLGTGTSSDGRGTSVVRPNTRGQCLALGHAWRASGCDPADLRMLEAHATGTQAGDAVELETIAGFFGAGRDRLATIGSVKSMLGHAMPAAGIAGFIKTALAVYHGVLLPTLHCEEPRAELEATRFAPRANACTWDDDSPLRLAAVNAFGFGGINAHVVLASAGQRLRAYAGVAGAYDSASIPEIARYARRSLADLLTALEHDDRGGEGEFRAAIVEPTTERRELASRIARRGRALHGQNGVFVSAQSMLARGGRIAFVFPGLDAGAPPCADRLADWLGENATRRSPAAEGLEAHGRKVIAVNRLVLRGLARLGIEPAVFAGHSIGEWSAIEAAGIADANELSELSQTLTPGSVGGHEVSFVSAGCSAERLSQLIGTDLTAAVSHDNCPHQAVVACPNPEVGAIVRLLSEHGVLAQPLPFGSGVHSRFFAPHLDRHLARIERLQLRASARPIYSATSCAPYPESPQAIREIIVRHMLEPVRFRPLIERMHADGARIFVQVGTGPLPNFIADTLRGRAHVAISAHGRERSDLVQLAHAACAVWVEGGDVQWQALASEPAVSTPPNRGRKLRLGAPLVRLSDVTLHSVEARTAIADLEPSGTSTVRTPGPERELAELMRGNFARMAEVQLEIERSARSVRAAATPDDDSSVVEHELSVATFPELRDHAFYRQPPAWPDLRDRAPLVPMTGLLELFSLGLDPRSTVAALHDVWAKRWLEVAEPKRVRITRCLRSDGQIEASIDDHAVARIELGPRPRVAPAYREWPLTRPRPVPIDARQLYAERFMFHGPAYQCVTALHELGDDGITGEIEAGPALGSLLDAAGQLLGLWLMLTQARDRFALPLRIGELRYYRDPPRPKERFACAVRITALEPERLTGDIRVGNADGLWVEIRDWQDYRFATDDALLQLSRWPERSLLCDVGEDGVHIERARYRSLKTYEMLLGNYLGASERTELAAGDPRQRWGRLLSRIAAKDAVRAALSENGQAARFPIELLATELDKDRYRVELADQSWLVAVASTEHDVSARIERATQIESKGDSAP